MLPNISEIMKTESTIQKEIIETMANSYIFTDVTPLQKCLAYWFDEWKEFSPCSTVAFNVFPLYTLSTIQNGKHNPLMIDVISQMLPELCIKDLKSMASWASDSWVKKVRFDDDISMLRSHAIASTISTEFDVYMVADNVQCCLELKLEAEFGKNFLLYQPFRQLLQLNILSKLYNIDNYYLYLVTMEKEATLKRHLSNHYPQYIKDFINIDLIKTLSWTMIREWLDTEGLKQYPILYKLRQRLDEYISTSKAFSRDLRRDLIKVPQFIFDTYYIRPTRGGEILELNGLDILGFYPGEVTVGFPVLSLDIQSKWITRFEDEGFKATPKQNYWSFKFDSNIPQKVENLLREFLEDICK